MQFWPRLEIFQSFVLSGLRSFLNVGQNRLEIRVSLQFLCETHPGPLGKGRLALQADVRLWPRVDTSRSFVFRELRHILHICQNRVEMRLRRGLKRSPGWECA